MARRASTTRSRSRKGKGANPSLFDEQDAPAAEVGKRSLSEEMEASFIDYAMSVIVSRALPDVRDGLKPVHRRLLWSMHAAGHRPGRPHVKSARVVGDTMGRLHPHGDAALYETLVRLAQPFSLGHPLVDGHGNFGSPADPPAAARYCVVGDTRVRTADGEVRIADISPDTPANSDADISLKVYDRHGALVEAEKFFHSGVHPTYKVVTESGREITGTDNHLLLVAAQDGEGAPGFAWKTIAELVPGDYCVIDRTVTPYGEATDDDMAVGLLAGALVPEGWASEKRSGFNNTHKEFFDLVVEAWDKVFGGTRYLSERLLKSGKPTYEIDCQNMSSYEQSILGEMIGSRSAEKRVPEAVWNGSEELRRWFLKAAYEGDGSVGAYKTIDYCSSSYGLLLDIQAMLLSFGIVGRIQWDDNRDSGTVTISNRRDIRLFQKRIGFLTRKAGELDAMIGTLSDAGNCSTSKDILPFVAEYARKNRHDGRLPGQNKAEWLVKRRIDTQERWEATGQDVLACVHEPAASKIRAFTENGYYFDRVGSITPDGLAPVYSLRLRSDERAFITNGFVSHNTEVRLDPIATHLLADIDENTVDFRPNFDGSADEPVVLPARFPNLLVNGVQGIAVGMASNIPPHNLGEVIDAALYLMKKPKAPVEELVEFVKGPDFPTGALILEPESLLDTYKTGRGAVKMRAATEIEAGGSRNGDTIVVTAIPYQTSVEAIESRIAELVEAGTIEGIRDLRNESAGGQTRFVIELKKEANTDVVLANLFKHTPLQQNFGLNMVALVNGVPRTLDLASVLNAWLEHQVEVITRRTQFRLDRAEARLHIVEGLLKAIDMLDEVVKTIRSSKDRGAARESLMGKKFGFSEIQANHILDMPLGRLTQLGRDELVAEADSLRKYIAELQKILNSRRALNTVIRKELEAVRAEFAVDRRTQIVAESAEIDATRLVADEPLVVTFTGRGYIKATPAKGRGAKVAAPTAGDVVTHVFDTTSLSHLVFFTDRGRAYKAKGADINTDRLTAIQNLFLFQPDEKVIAVMDAREGVSGPYAVLVADNGNVKKVMLDDMGGERRDGAVAMGLGDGDTMVAALDVADGDDVFLATRDGQCIRFPESETRPMGRAAAGVRGIKLKGDDKVVSAARLRGDDALMVFTTAGNAKRSNLDEFPQQSRAGGGVLVVGKLTSRTGKIAAVLPITGRPDVIVTSGEGDAEVVKATAAPPQPRAGSGSKVVGFEPRTVHVHPGVTAEDE